MHYKDHAKPDATSKAPVKCRARRRNGEPCQNYPVQGRPVCRMHGGMGGRPITTAKGALRAIERDSKTRQEVERIAQEPGLLDLTKRAAFCVYLERRLQQQLDSGEALDERTLQMCLAAIDTTRKTAESIVKIQIMQQELLSKKQTEATYAVLESIFALCLENPEMPVSAVLDQLRERLFNFRAVAQLPEPAIEGEVIE